MNIVADIGNTFVKAAVFDYNNLIKEKIVTAKTNSKDIRHIISEIKKAYKNIDNLILSTVKEKDSDLEIFLRNNFKNFILFDSDTGLPVENKYKTPETLGKDRIAAVVAASNIFPGSNVLVFDAGTALTVDFINDKKEYYGGSISPGLKMRFKALNKFTDKLPETEPNGNFNAYYGKNTEEAILSGVQNGMIYEIEGHVKKYSEKYKDLKVTITGGDTFFFEKKLNFKIFAEPDLVLTGLNIILNYNVK